MCTVTFIPVEDVVYFTHNRDEQKDRPRATPPALHLVNGFKLLYPKDGKAGGTWIAMNENGSAAVLLNGGFVKHTPLPFYRKSRGLVLLDIMASDNLLKAWQDSNLHNIEPFTLIFWSKYALWECRWDGSQKYAAETDPRQSHIWSSATLYDKHITAKRKGWFNAWQENHPSPSLKDIIQFQTNAGDGNAHHDLRMDRGLLLTVSITSMQMTAGEGLMKYIDLQEDNTHEQKMTFNKVPVES